LHRKDQRLAATNENLIDVARRDDTLIVFPHTQRTGGKTFRDAAGGRGAVSRAHHAENAKNGA